MLTASPSPDALRQRRYGRRQRDGIAIVPVAVTDDDIEELIEQGLLDEEASSDRKAVAAAILRALRG
jgi:hypothetical protein